MKKKLTLALLLLLLTLVTGCTNLEYATDEELTLTNDVSDVMCG